MGAVEHNKNATGSQLSSLYEILKNLFDNKFYGSLEVKFEAGKVTIIRKSESIKL